MEKGMDKRLLLYDTSNFRDYPVGGQVTSIKGFLRYLGESHPKKCHSVLLIGVSFHEEEIGVVQDISINDCRYSFIAVALASSDLNAVKKSLRLEYVKGLLKYRHILDIKKTDCNYIHTPEAYGVIKLLCKDAFCYVFSHGTYLNMYNQLRFFKKLPILRVAFQYYLISVIKHCNHIFVLDCDTQKSYRKYNMNVTRVGNSIVCRNYISHNFDRNNIKLLFAGRLSKVKNIAPIIEAVKEYPAKCSLIILGAGEEMDNLRRIANDRIKFVGAVQPDKVIEYMQNSDILVMNSVKEGIPMTILEAISMSMPVITTDVGGISEVLYYGVDSEKTDGSKEEIIIAINKIAANYKQYSIKAHSHSQEFDYRNVNKKVFQKLNEFLNW